MREQVNPRALCLLPSLPYSLPSLPSLPYLPYLCLVPHPACCLKTWFALSLWCASYGWEGVVREGSSLPAEQVGQAVQRLVFRLLDDHMQSVFGICLNRGLRCFLSLVLVVEGVCHRSFKDVEECGQHHLSALRDYDDGRDLA